jgi:hypothetical protein
MKPAIGKPCDHTCRPIHNDLSRMFLAFSATAIRTTALCNSRPPTTSRRGVCYGEDYTFIYVLLLAALSAPGIIRKLETELIGFGPTAWVIYAKGNDNNTIDVELFARRDSGLRNARKAHGLCESRIWMHKAAIRASCR